jgi:hypothetical protein
VRIWLEMHLKEQISRRTAASARAALAGQADLLALPHALGDLHIQAVFLHAHAALGIGPFTTQCDGAWRTLIGITQVDDDLGVMVLTTPWSWPGTPATALARLTK